MGEETLVKRLRRHGGLFGALFRRSPETAPCDTEAGGALSGLPLGAGRALIEQLPAPLILLDARGRALLVNREAERMIGAQMAGRHISSLLRAPALLDAVQAVLDDRVSMSTDFEISGPPHRAFSVRIGPVSGAGEAAAMILLEDRTRARRAERLHMDFVANASHELRTPLASIAGIIETLRGHARDDPAAQAHFLGIMERQAARMRRLVDDLLSLARIELDEHVPPRAVCDLGAVLEETAATMRPVAEARGVTLHFEPPPTEVRIPADADQIAQVFVNLLDNAIKYGAEGGVARLVALGPDGSVPARYGVLVEDDGPGVAKHHLGRLTERFYRVDIARSRDRGGTGLGLAIVKHIVARHRGELRIDSAPSAGSRFVVWLPLLADQARSETNAVRNLRR